MVQKHFPFEHGVKGPCAAHAVSICCCSALLLFIAAAVVHAWLCACEGSLRLVLCCLMYYGMAALQYAAGCEPFATE
jgi:hypothetical protein